MIQAKNSAYDNPILKAFFDYLPKNGEPFGTPQRNAWLAGIRQAFILIYGPEDPVTFPVPTLPESLRSRAERM